MVAWLIKVATGSKSMAVFTPTISDLCRFITTRLSPVFTISTSVLKYMMTLVFPRDFSMER